MRYEIRTKAHNNIVKVSSDAEKIQYVFENLKNQDRYALFQDGKEITPDKIGETDADEPHRFTPADDYLTIEELIEDYED